MRPWHGRASSRGCRLEVRRGGISTAAGAEWRFPRKVAHGLELVHEETSPRSEQWRHMALGAHSVAVAIALVGEGSAGVARRLCNDEHPLLGGAVDAGRFARAIHKLDNG